MHRNASLQLCEILNLESFILFARYSLALHHLEMPLEPYFSSGSRDVALEFPNKNRRNARSGRKIPFHPATVKYHYSCLPQSVRSNIAGNDYPPFLMPPLSMFRVIYEIEARHEDEILLILLILEFPSMFDPWNGRANEDYYSNNIITKLVILLRYRKISSSSRAKEKDGLSVYNDLLFVKRVDNKRQISPVSRAIVRR